MFRSFRFVAVAMLIAGVIATATPMPAALATSGPTTSIVQQGMQLLAKYNIPPTALDNLIPMLNNPSKLIETLTGYGLTKDQIAALTDEAAPLLKEAGLDIGAVKNYVAEQALKDFEKNEIPQELLDDVLSASDKDAAKKVLEDAGIDSERADTALGELDPYMKLGLDRRALGYYLADQGRDMLEKYGVPDEALAEIVAALNPARTHEILSKYGMDAASIDQFRGEMNGLIAQGFKSDDVSYYAAVEVNDLLAKHGLPTEVVQEAVALYNAGKMNELMALAAEHQVTPEAFSEIEKGLIGLASLGLDVNAVLDVAQELETAEAELGEALQDDVSAEVEAMMNDNGENGGEENSAGGGSEQQGDTGENEAEASETPQDN